MNDFRKEASARAYFFLRRDFCSILRTAILRIALTSPQILEGNYINATPVIYIAGFIVSCRISC